MRFGRKKEDPSAPGEAENESKSGKGGLFGFRSQDKSPAQSTNPYAAPTPSQNPYAARSANGNPYAAGPARRDPYSASDASLTQPPTSSFGSLSLKSEGNAPPPYTYSAQTDARRNEKSAAGQAASPRFQPPTAPSYGAGYGGDNYGSAQPARMNSYGGMARQRSQDTLSTDAGRSALFGAAPQRLRQQASEPSKAVGLPPQSQVQDTSYSNTANYGSDSMPGDYGDESASFDAQMKSEDEKVAEINAEADKVRDQSIAALSNAKRTALQTRETAKQTLDTLMTQTHMLNNARSNIDLAHKQTVVAEGKISDLKTANRSMFVPRVANPFTKAARERAEDDVAVAKRREERELRVDVQASRYDSQARLQQVDHELSRGPPAFRGNLNHANKAKYRYELTDEGEEKEDRIEYDLDETLDVIKDIRLMANVMGTELDKHKRQINDLSTRTDKLDDNIVKNAAGLSRAV